jgi:hypothetical protein
LAFYAIIIDVLTDLFQGGNKHCQKFFEKGGIFNMAELTVKETDGIFDRVSEENRKLGDIVGLWLKEGPEGECLLRVVPCKMKIGSSTYTTTKGIDKENWDRTLRFHPDGFDFDGVAINKELFRMRLNLNLSVFISYHTEEEEYGEKSCFFKIQTINAYIPEDYMSKIRDKITSLDDRRVMELLAGRAVDLPNEMKPQFLQRATDMLVDFLLEHAKPEIVEVVKATEAYCRERFR